MCLDVYTVHEYADSLSEHPALVDRLSKCGFDNDDQSKDKLLYPEHLALSTIQSGVKSGKYLQGVFQGSRENYLEGFVNVSSLEKFVLVQGLQHLNRSVHEDVNVVAIELFAEDRCTNPSYSVLKS